MFTSFERMVAGRYLRSRKAEGFVSVIAGFSFLGIMLGVATLIIVMAVMNGFRQELITRILGLNGHINVYSQVGSMYDYDVTALKLEEIESIKSVFPMVEGQALLSFNNNSTGVVVRGYNLSDFLRKPIISESIIAGNIKDFTGTKVAIGNAMAERLNLRIGDLITLIAPKGKVTPFGTIPRSRSYEISLIFDVGMYEYNSGFVFMPLKTAQIFFQYQDTVSSLEVITDDPLQIDYPRSAVAMELQGIANVYDWRDLNDSFFNALKVERNVMFLILTLIILVAAFNIISSMIMLVKDKSHDIAIMRTMGASRDTMLKIFVLTGASIGFFGTFVGAVLGISFAQNIETIRRGLERLTGTDLFAAEIYFLSQLPASIEWTEVFAVILMALILSILATLYPAWRAARLDPVEALRYE
jgi:lipoprotein-releasing system permease protein